MFEYVFTIAGTTPTLSTSYKGTGDNKMLNISFNNGNNYSSIVHFEIYRYGVALPSVGEYNEYVEGELVNTINFNQDIWSYDFYLGGEYFVVFTDSFGRVTISETIKFKKGLPTYTIKGVEDGGKTNKSVSIEFLQNIGYEALLDGELKVGLGANVSNGYKIEIPAVTENNGNWQITLYVKSDVNTKISIQFTIDTIAPLAKVYDGADNLLTWNTCVNKLFYVSWDISENVSKAKYSIDNSYLRNYEKGQVNSENGIYTFTISDEVGNSTTYTIELDTSVLYKITFVGEQYEENNTKIVKNGFSIEHKENLSFTIKRNGVEIEGKSNMVYSVEGIYEIELCDVVGNKDIFNVIIDQTAPTILVEQDGDEYSSITTTIDTKDVATFKITFNGKVIEKELATEWEFSDWGNYTITIADRLGNSKVESFSILKIAPIISIYNDKGELLENGASTNQSIYFTWNDSQATGKVFIQGYTTKIYEQNTLLTEEGVYTITITDEANNKVSATISIVKVIDFKFITESGVELNTKVIQKQEKTTNSFTITYDSELFVDAKKDGETFIFVKGQYITMEGEYYFNIYDSLGNYEERTIVVDRTAPTLRYEQGIDLSEPVKVLVGIEDISTIFVEHKTIQTNQSYYVPEMEYVFKQWGDYKIVATDELGNSSTINFAIKKVLPKILFKTLSDKTIEEDSLINEQAIILYEEELIIKYSIDNGYKLIYKPDTILTEQGRYNIEITDIAGQVITFGFSIDNDIICSGIADGVTIKNLEEHLTIKRYYELGIGEKLKATYSLNNSDYIEFQDTIHRFTEEGEYEILLVDEAGNSKRITFLIDRQAPKSSIDTETITKSDVVFSVEDLNDVASYKVLFNSQSMSKFILKNRNIFTEEGTYTITIMDALGNKSVTEFSIKRKINYRMNIVNGFITDAPVTLTLRETGITIIGKLNGEVLTLDNATEYKFEQAGDYEFTITDSVGNVKELTFKIDENKYKKSFSYTIPLDSEISIKKDGKDIYIDDYIEGDNLTLFEDGEYNISIKKDGLTSNYKFEIDTIIPSLVFNGKEVESGYLGKYKKDITLTSSKKKSTLKVYYNGEEIDYIAGEKISAMGDYKVVIIDEVGNVVEYTFTREFTFNKGAIILFVMLGLAIVLIVVLVIRHRIKMKIR